MEALEEVLKRRCSPVVRLAGGGLDEQLKLVSAARPFVMEEATASWCCSSWRDDTAASVARDLVSTIPVPVASGAYDTAPARVPLHDFLATKRGYLRDFHCLLDHVAAGHEAAAELYTVPAAFADDCLNTLFDARNLRHAGAAPLDDYRFLYWGGAGTSTMLHFDVLYSASWSANVAGYKLWLLCPPASCEAALYDAFGELTTRDLRTRDEVAATQKAISALGGGADATPVLGGGSAADGGVVGGPVDGAAAALPMHYIIQRPGDAVFVPGGWHHQVHNLTEALSINHNWFGCTHLPSAWRFLATEAARVRTSLDDCRTIRPAAPSAGAAASDDVDDDAAAAAAATTGFDARLGAVRSAPLDAEFEALVQRVLRMNAALNFDDFMTLVLLKGRELLWQQTKWPMPTGASPASAAERVDQLPVLAAPHVLPPAWYRRQCVQAMVDTITTMLLTEPSVANAPMGAPRASVNAADAAGAPAAAVAAADCADNSSTVAGDIVSDGTGAASSTPPSLQLERSRLRAVKKRQLLALDGMTAADVDELIDLVLALPEPGSSAGSTAGTAHAATDCLATAAWQRAVDLPSLRRELLAVLSATTA